MTLSADPPFLTVFRSACDELDAGVEDTRRLLALLVELVGTALTLPDAEPESDEDGDRPPGLDDASRKVASMVQSLVGGRDFYFEIFDSSDIDASSGAGSLADDVSDIYRDLRSGLHQDELGHHQDAIWEWRFSFENHWGRHATSAIKVLHQLITE